MESYIITDFGLIMYDSDYILRYISVLDVLYR
jgi:hypothetical protein